jgi:glycerophosphoryl diester phosphodiesterase
MFPPFTYLSYTTILISYAFASYLLLKFPNLLWKKRRYQNELLNEAIDGKRVLHISHRGGTRERLENTIEAFKNACKIGSDILELDVHLTKDHKVVVCHDTILDRLCGVNVCVNDLNYADLPPFSENVFMHFSNN